MSRPSCVMGCRSHERTGQQARALCHLYAQVDRVQSRACLQLARCPTRGLRGIYKEPSARRLGADLPTLCMTIARAAHLRETDCVAGHVGLELRNVVANIPLKARADSQDPSRILAQRLFAFEARRRGYAARARCSIPR